MIKTIGNPGSWALKALFGAAENTGQFATDMVGDEKAEPQIQTLTFEDIREALRMGFADFIAARVDVMFICVIYPVVGILLAGVAANANLLPLVFPIAAGFALLGPFAAIGLYEVSRRRENGEDTSWLAALGVVRSPGFPAMLVLGLYMIALFAVWLLVAYTIYQSTLGPEPPRSVAAFTEAVLTTSAGWTMIFVGMGVGFLFALAALITSVVSFPLLLDRHVGIPLAVVTSYRVFRANPRVILTWGLVVAVLLLIGSIPAFVGLIVVLPVLGHATWHLYRRAVRF